MGFADNVDVSERAQNDATNTEPCDALHLGDGSVSVAPCDHRWIPTRSRRSSVVRRTSHDGQPVAAAPVA